MDRFEKLLIILVLIILLLMAYVSTLETTPTEGSGNEMPCEY